jgi:hypothetical protein
VTVSDYCDSADCDFIRDDDRDRDRHRHHTWEGFDARCDETRDGQHPFVTVVIVEDRNAGIDRSCCGCTVTRQMRVHLPRVVVRGLVVVEMDVRHRSGDGAHLNCNG